jgi:hypothetical protein
MSYDKRLHKDARGMLKTKNDEIECHFLLPCSHGSIEENLKRAVVVDGVHFMSLKDVIAWKKCIGRPKDYEHIKMIEKYIRKNNVVENYLQSIQEGYIFSEKTISVNLHLFENGTKNKLIITGVPGSGKTSLLHYLLKKYNVNDFVSDDSWGKTLEGLTSSKRTIVEGGGFLILYKEEVSWRKMMLDTPMILMGMSAIKSGWRADKRDETVPGKVKDWKDTYHFTRTNLFYFQNAANLLRKDLMKLPDAKIEEYKVPKFKTVLNR